ncbi:MAG: IPT/TIG domain-containing protein [Anaerolineales bacterium]
MHADQAQYFYDELGRLVGVVDGQGNAAVYNYDEVGNLLSIQRFTSGTTGIGIFVVAPNSARVGTTVTIKGFGFTTPASSNQVAFNSTSAVVVSATSTSIVATVPTGATTGPVTVTNASGTATSPQAFTVLVPPIITGVDTLKVPSGVTSRLLIEGFNLAATTSVTFRPPGTTTPQAGMTTTIQAGGTETHLPITVTVGAAVPLGAYEFVVTTPVGTTQSGTILVQVVAAAPTLGLGQSVSVYRPVPAQVAPSGPSATVAPNVSVQIVP